MNKDFSNKYNFSKSIPTYLGQKGYTVLKKDLSEQELTFIKKELTVKPFIQGAPPGSNEVSYPVYRESAQKIYLPRFYGQQNFGPPKETKIPEGMDIDIPFSGSLRPNQIPVVEKYMSEIGKGSSGGFLELGCAFGKTILSLYLCSLLKKKTLIIVHKEFLMNQWIERIQQFLPTAKVGKIQGKVIDIEGKDIVIGMLQSLSMKEYDGNIFDSFGLAIFDEMHHISSEVFSRILFKLVTKYVIGLSATMERKDGTSYVFRMFLGEVVFKGTREKDEYDVIVRAIEYKTNDEDFNKIALDYRGNVQYSTMISKLCVFNPRTEFILKILQDMLVEKPDQQIIILAHNRNILAYIHDAIVSRNICSCGFYVGGMKEMALKESESKKVVVASYAMAAEALDIPTLGSLIMCSPKSEIEQVVGRILRKKDGKKIIVDIIDSHQCFKNQFNKRKTFYKKQNYKIIKSSNFKYSNNFNKWDILFESNSCFNYIDDDDDVDDVDILSKSGCLIKYKPLK
jgi:superfamily II DNA or RNA helicase